MSGTEGESENILQSETVVEQMTTEVPVDLVYDVLQLGSESEQRKVTPSSAKKVKRRQSLNKDKVKAKSKLSKPSFKRRRSGDSRKKRRPRNIHLQKQQSLPASYNSVLSPSACFFGLAPSDDVGSPLSSPAWSTSSDTSSSSVPKILTQLMTSLNEGTMQNAGITSPCQLTSFSLPQATPLSTLTTPTSTLTTPLFTPDTLPPPLISGDNSNRVPGILDNLVTYLTTETMQHTSNNVDMVVQNSGNNEDASAVVVRYASSVTTEPVIQPPMDIEICASPFSSLASSERTPFPSDCEASGEYESDEDVRKRERRREYVDADSLFHPGSDALFTVGEDEPPLFILPRLACAGDFPLEVDPSCVSSVALDLARQSIIHAPPNSDLVRDVSESEVSELVESNSSAGTVEGRKTSSNASHNVRQRKRSSGQPKATPPATPSSGKNIPKSRIVVGKEAKVKHSSPSSSKASRTEPKSSKVVSKVTAGTKVIRKEGVVVGGVSIKDKKIIGVAKDRAPGKKEKGMKLELQLRKHLAKLEELKGNLASKSTSQTTTSNISAIMSLNVKGQGTSSGQSRTTGQSKASGQIKTSGQSSTSGQVRIKFKQIPEKDKGKSELARMATIGSAKSGSKVSIESEMKEIAKIVKAERSKSVPAPASLASLSGKLDLFWQTNQQSLLEVGPHPLPVRSCNSPSTVPCLGLTVALSREACGEKIISLPEKFEKVKKPMPSSLCFANEPPRSTTYRPYSSPLLMFQSYRLNPLYRTNEKLPLHSLSHSNKIDPNRIMCRFELGGICNNASCSGQHFKDITPNKEEVIQDLVCYAPQLAGCSVYEEDGESLVDSHKERETKKKITSYASQMVERYSSKVPDEDLFKLTIHDVNKERARAKASYISFDDRTWLASEGGRNASPLSLDHPISLMARKQGEGETVGHGMEWDTISKQLVTLGRPEQVER